METLYDVAVLGAGPGGYTAALRAAMRGAKVCCINAGELGGTCLNVGCIPTKAMLHAGELFHQLGHAKEFGIAAGQMQLDFPAMMQRTRELVDNLRGGVADLLKDRLVDYITGRGRLVAADTIDVAGRMIRAKAVIIATGSRPSRPAFLPWDSPLVLTTDEATRSTELPTGIVIVGGGIIGCEFATIYSELGVTTTVVEVLGRLAAGLDQEAARFISRSLAKRNVTVLTGAKIVSARPVGAAVTLQLEDGKTIQAPCVLAATGRPPNTQDIGLETLGVAMDGAVIRVDEHCRTSVPGIYAVGDAAEKRQYAHLASRMGSIAADNATGHEAADDRTVVPAGVYTHPEVAAVGMSEAQARATGEVKIARFSYQASGMAQAYGQTEGIVKLIAAASTGKLLGALIVGPHATDSIHEVALAMRQNLRVEDLAGLIHAHPTFAEAIGDTAQTWLGTATHMLLPGQGVQLPRPPV